MSVFQLAVVIALVLTIAAAFGNVPLWYAVLAICLGLLTEARK